MSQTHTHQHAKLEVHEATTTRKGFDIQTAGGKELIAFNVKGRAWAELFAAAPELLAACEDVIEALHIAGYDIHGTRSGRMLLAAVSKATGHQ